MAKNIKTPVVGALAWHKNGLDPREVVDVSPDGKGIRIFILTSKSDWLPASNYDFSL